MDKNTVRVRIAPSPTGNLHIGTARAALFNELFARHAEGTFIVRFEDTDRKRSVKKYEEMILEGMTWLGLTWDEGPDIGGLYGPYRQSERTSLYIEALSQLLKKNHAYRKDEAILLRVEDETIHFKDEIRGDVSIHTSDFGRDFIIARSLTDPLYHLAVVVDDAQMRISHVIRGEDHLHNTAKHILIQRALGYIQPIYVHLPLILNELRGKLSKRNQDVNLLEYRNRGYLPEAMMNGLAFLGWNPKNSREFFTHDELIQSFSLNGIQKNGAIFSQTKLDAFNKHYMRSFSALELLDRTKPFLNHERPMTDDKTLILALATEQERCSTLAELSTAVSWANLNWKPTYPPELLVWKDSDRTTTHDLLVNLSERLMTIPYDQFTEDHLQKKLMLWIDENNLGRGPTLWPMRVSITGKEHSPGPFEIASIIGKKETLRRVSFAIEKLTAS